MSTSGDLSADDRILSLQNLVEKARRLANAEGTEPKIKAALANSLADLSVALTEASRIDEALEAALEGSTLYRALATDDPAQFALALASSLDILSVRLNEAGYGENAQTIAGEAEALARELLRNDFQDARFTLISILMNQSSRYWMNQDTAQGLEVMQEGVTLYREGGQAMLQYLGLVIDAMHRNALILSEKERWDDALLIRRLTLELFEGGRAPAQMFQLFAMTLMQSSFALSRAGKPGQGLPMAEEAVEIARALADLDATQYRLFLAQALGALAGRQHEADAHVEALEVASEAVNVFQEIAKISPVTVIRPLTATLDTFASVLNALGYTDQARNVIAQRDELRNSLRPTE